MLKKGLIGKFVILLGAVYIFVIFFALNLDRNSNLIIRSTKNIAEESEFLVDLQNLHAANSQASERFQLFLDDGSAKTLSDFELLRSVSDSYITELHNVNYVFLENGNQDKKNVLDVINAQTDYEKQLVERVKDGENLNLQNFNREYELYFDETKEVISNTIHHRNAVLNQLRDENSDYIYYSRGARMAVVFVTPIFAIFILIFAKRTVIKPITALTQQVKLARDGKWNIKISHKSDDEIGILFSEIQKLLREYKKKASNNDKSLSQKEREIKKMGTELDQKIAEFQNLSDSLVVREEKMKELKDQIKEISKSKKK